MPDRRVAFPVLCWFLNFPPLPRLRVKGPRHVIGNIVVVSIIKQMYIHFFFLNVLLHRCLNHLQTVMKERMINVDLEAEDGRRSS